MRWLRRTLNFACTCSPTRRWRPVRRGAWLFDFRRPARNGKTTCVAALQNRRHHLPAAAALRCSTRAALRWRVVIPPPSPWRRLAPAAGPSLLRGKPAKSIRRSIALRGGTPCWRWCLIQ